MTFPGIGEAACMVSMNPTASGNFEDSWRELIAREKDVLELNRLTSEIYIYIYIYMDR